MSMKARKSFAPVIWDGPLGIAVLTNVYDPRKLSKKKRKDSKPKLFCENTYILEPLIKFPQEEAQEMIEIVLEEYLKDQFYDARTHANMSKVIAQELRERLRVPGLERFRLVTSVTIGEKKKQDVRVGSRCLWDTNRDSCAAANFENQSLFATAVVYAIYQE